MQAQLHQGPRRAAPQPTLRATPSSSTLRALALLVVLGLGCGACQRGEGAERNAFDGPQRARDLPRVRVAPVAVREVFRTIEDTTVVESEHEIEVFPKASGEVVELLVEEGDSVAAGQPLARLDDREAAIAVSDARVGLEEARVSVEQLALATAEAEARSDSARRTFEQAQRDHDRNESIAARSEGRTGLISAKDLEASGLARDTADSEYRAAQLAHQRAQIDEQAARNAVQRAQLALDQAELALSHTVVAAPFEGVIARRDLEVGAMASAAAAAFVLTDPEHLRAVFHRPQRELALFTPGGGDHGGVSAELDLSARAEALPGRVFAGRIERIAPVIDRESGTFRVTARLERRDAQGVGADLRPGMLVRLTLVTERRPDALVVPKRSLRREGEVSLVFAVRDGLAQRVEVHEGFPSGDDVEVRPAGDARLEVGDLVVVVGNRELEDGAAVEVEDPRAPAADEAPEAPQDDPEPPADEVAGAPRSEEPSTDG